VERAERSQAPVEKTADRYAGYLVYFAIACAAMTFALTRDARSTISVIIVAGACGIAAGTPLAILGAIGRAARTGAIIKGGRYLETLWRVDVVALDKTGTVTVGAPEVLAIHPAPGVSDRALVEAATIAERRSEHPLPTRSAYHQANPRRLGTNPAAGSSHKRLTARFLWGAVPLRVTGGLKAVLLLKTISQPPRPRFSSLAAGRVWARFSLPTRFGRKPGARCAISVDLAFRRCC
jgi:magnesium-transporting ATPase (P-type)